MGYTVLDYVLFLIVEKQTIDTLDFCLLNLGFLACILWEGRVVLRNCAAIFCFEGVSANEKKLLTMRKTSKFDSFNKDALNR